MTITTRTTRLLLAFLFNLTLTIVGGRAVAGSSCGSDSDCAGYGRCSSGQCGHCGSDSDCNGHGRCSNGRCGSCGSDSDCTEGRCSNGKCGACGSDSDCHGGRCSNGRCSNAH